MINILIVHYNTPKLLKACVKSIYNYVKSDFRLYIFENSDSNPIDYITPEMTIFDNTNSDIIDFNEIINKCNNKRTTINNYGSAKHTYTINKCFDLIPEGFIHIDSDALVKTDISDLYNSNYIYSGEITKVQRKIKYRIPRLAPFICYINVPMCKKYNIKYFDYNRTWELNDGWYDTGASFLQDCNTHNLIGNKIKYLNYIYHLGAGSWKQHNIDLFLHQYKYVHM